jgi:hypothetical protein
MTDFCDAIRRSHAKAGRGATSDEEHRFLALSDGTMPPMKESRKSSTTVGITKQLPEGLGSELTHFSIETDDSIDRGQEARKQKTREYDGWYHFARCLHFMPRLEVLKLGCTNGLVLPVPKDPRFAHAKGERFCDYETQAEEQIGLWLETCRNMPSGLQHLDLNNTMNMPASSDKEKSESMEEWLERTAVRDFVCRTLAEEALPRMTNLRVLNLEGWTMGDPGLRWLSKGLTTAAKSLQSLKMYEGLATAESVGNEFATMLATAKGLRYFKFSDFKRVEDEGMAALVTALSTLPKLQVSTHIYHYKLQIALTTSAHIYSSVPLSKWTSTPARRCQTSARR